MQTSVRLCTVIVFLAVSAAAVAQPSYRPSAARTLLRAGKVLDVRSGKEIPNETLVISGENIVAVALTANTPAMAGDRVVDLTGYTLMPGMIDVHTHLTMATNFDPYFELTMTPGKEAILGVENAKTTLEAGFTTVRNVGANGFTDVALRDEINAGHIPGPPHAGLRPRARHHRRPHG
jgi:imidazolonepropionase-like amidohydrolase